MQERGRLQVREGGRTLVGHGIAEGQCNPIRLRLIDADRATYLGRVRVDAAGAVMTLTYRARVVTSERIEGELTGRVTVDGPSCTIRRGVVSDHPGD